MRPRFEHLDGLRGLAALNVMLGHALLAFDFTLYTGNPAESHAAWDVALSASPMLLPIAGQNFSVAIFLAMSGFVLAHAFDTAKLGAPALAAKRFTRLAVPIAAATLFAWALLASGLMAHGGAERLTHSGWLRQQMAHGANLPDALTEGLFGALLGPWTYAGSYNSALWTMSVEFAGSMLLLAVFTARRRLGHGRKGFAAAAPLVLMGATLYPAYVSLMLFGAALYLLDLRRVRLPPPLTAALAALAILGGTVPYSAARGPWWDAVVALAPGSILPIPLDRLGPAAARMDAPACWHALGALLLLLVVETGPGLRRRLAHPRLAALGLISFPLYIVHIPVLLSVGCGVFLLALGAGLPYAAAAAVAITAYAAAALTLATTAVGTVEQPAIRAANRLATLVDGIGRTTRRTPTFPLPPEPVA